MELAKLKKDEILSFDKQRLGEVAHEIRRELAVLRMDVYSDNRRQAGAVRGLRKSLARVMTYRNDLRRNQTK